MTPASLRAAGVASVDRAVTALGAVFRGTGRSGVTIEIDAADLVRAGGGRVDDFARAS